MLEAAEAISRPGNSSKFRSMQACLVTVHELHDPCSVRALGFSLLKGFSLVRRDDRISCSPFDDEYSNLKAVMSSAPARMNMAQQEYFSALLPQYLSRAVAR